MRIVGAVLVVVAALWPGFGVAAPKAKPTDKPTAAQTKPPAPGTPRAVYAAMPEPERMAIQSDLIWTGDYNGMITGDFGDNSVAAVRTFQKRNGGKDTGILNPDERSKLAESARAKRERAGWRIVDDRVTGSRLALPGKVVTQATETARGSRWQSSHGEVQVETFRIATAGATLGAIMDRLKKDYRTRQAEYQVLKPEFFVISGLQNGVKKFYTRAELKDGDVRGVTILYDLAVENTMEPMVVAMSNTFVGFPSGPLPVLPGPVARRDVEYATGIVVSKAGHIVTDRQAVDDCKSIVVPGLGNAERVAEDKSADVALLRVFGAQDLVPATIAGDLGGGSDVTLIGIADPERQNGGGAISTVKARLLAPSGPSRPIEPAPALGFSGSAAIDGEAKFLGMVRSPAGAGGSAAAMVPAEAIRMFLYAHSIAPTNGRASMDDAKASVVRVICVRK